MIDINNNTINREKVVRRKAIKLGIIGGALTVIGVSIVVGFPIVLNFIFDLALVYRKDGLVVKIIEHGNYGTPFTVPIKLYFWNLDNPDEFLAGAKPHFTEKGPYVWGVYAKREFEDWGPEEEYVSVYNFVTFVHQPDKTIGTLNDTITMLNPVTYAGAAGVANVLNRIPFSFTVAPIIYGFMKAWFYAHDEGSIRVTTVGDFIEGKYMPMLKTVETMLKPVRWLGLDKYELIAWALKMFEQHTRENKFGVFWAANNTKIGPAEVFTGKFGFRDFERVRSFHGKSVLSHWDDPKCNQIRGTEGLFGKTFLSKDDNLYLFIGELGRGLYLSYKDYSFSRGFVAWRYHMPPALFASPDKNPENKCYCTTPYDYSRCDGIYDLGPPYFGVPPVAISYAHFLYASEKIQGMVEGIDPDPAKHESHLDVNSVLGVPIGGKVRIQANLFVKPIPMMIGFGSLPEAVYPLIWVEVDADVDGILAFLFAIAMNLFWAIYLSPFLFILLGMLVLSFTAMKVYKERDLLVKPRVLERLQRQQTNRLSERAVTRIESLNTIDPQMQTKAQQMYPNLYPNNSGEPLRASRALAINNYSPQQLNRRDSVRSHRMQTPLNGSGPTQGRLSMSPPGAIE